MKRINSSDSLGVLISMCPTSDEQSPGSNHIYNRDNEYQAILEGIDEEGYMEESGQVPAEKKRRLSMEQVKALEKNFEVENKLDPERKVKLAQELGLQPRQVAVWFQNRRARWKTKQLERDFGVLKSNFDSLKHNYDSLNHDKEALLKEIRELKSKLNEDNTNTTTNNLSIKEEALVTESDNKSTEPNNTTIVSEDHENLMKGKKSHDSAPDLVFSEFKDGQSSDSDSSAILNEDQSPNASNSSSVRFIQNHPLLMSPNSSTFRFNCSSSSSSSINCFNFSDPRSDGLGSAQNHNNNNVYHPQFVKMEEHNFFGGEEDCNFFSEDQAPTLNWYCADQWT